MSDWRSCDNCDNYQCYKHIVERGIETKKPCIDWEPILCRCGGALSEVREHNGKKYRHCYSCHGEFFLEAEHG